MSGALQDSRQEMQENASHRHLKPFDNELESS
jgi:hypothetical protein